MISSIPIIDDFTLIDAEYKRFKKSIYDKWSECNEFSLDLEEKKLINFIFKILNDEQRDHEENLIRALICAQTLSKYTLVNQNECVNLFIKIFSTIPQSIQKRLFLFKCIAKQCRKKTNSYCDTFTNKILPIISHSTDTIASIQNRLIYIDFLIKYSPNFVYRYSDSVFYNLIKIIKDQIYKLDVNFNQNDSFLDNKCFANKAIELLRSILLKIKSIRYQAININEILNWPLKVNSLILLSVLLETCSGSFLKPFLSNLTQEFIKCIKNNDEQEIQCLASRNLIFCLKLNSDLVNSFDSDFKAKIFLFDESFSENLIYAKLTNLVLLSASNKINNFLQISDICEVLKKFIDNENSSIKECAFSLLNTLPDFSKIDPALKAQIIKQNHLKFDKSAKFIFDTNQDQFVENLITSLDSNTLETLIFLNGDRTSLDDDDEFNCIKKENVNYFIKDISDENKEKVSMAVFSKHESNDERVRSLVPLALAQINPQQMFSSIQLPTFFNMLVCESSNQVKLSILQSFNYHLTPDNISTYSEIYNQFSMNSASQVFNCLLIESSPRNIQAEVIKLLCKFIKVQNIESIAKFTPTIKNYLTFFNNFSGENDMSYSIIPKNLMNISEHIPIIFDQFHEFSNEYFQSFYNFAMDFMNNVTVNTDDNYQNRTSLQLKIRLKTFFQFKFFESTFCSFIKALKVIIKQYPQHLKDHSDEIINFCLSKLHHGVTEKETQSILSLLEVSLLKIGLKETIEFNKRVLFDGTNLFTVVFNTGSHFISPIIHSLVFRILGFIGVQLLYNKPSPLYTTLNLNEDLKHYIWKLIMSLRTNENIKYHIMIYYSVCSNSLFKILEDQSMSTIHLITLEALIDVQNVLSQHFIDDSFLQFKDDFTRCFSKYKKIEENCEYQEKKHMLKLLEKMVTNNFKLIEDCIPGMVQSLVSLWEIGSILPAFIKNLKSHLAPYLNTIITLVRSSIDQDQILELLFDLYVNCVLPINDSSHFYIDIINLFIEMAENGNFKAFEYLEKLALHINDIDYSQNIIQMCFKYIYQAVSNNNNDDNNHLKKVIKILINLLFKNKNQSEILSDVLDDYVEEVQNRLAKFHVELDLFNMAYDNFKNGLYNFQMSSSSSSFSSSISFDSLYESTDKITEFLNLFNNFNNNEINSLYVQQWLNELILFTIENSPSPFVKCTSKVAKSNPVFALSIFNIAFHSFCFLINENNAIYDKIPFRKYKNEISQTFQALFKKTSMSSYCHIVLTSLLEFMDRANLALIGPEDFNGDCPPVPSMFRLNPSLALRYALLHFEAINKNPKDSNTNAINDLASAYLNIGSFRQYHHFSLLFKHANSQNDFKTNNLLPIHSNKIESINLINEANNFFKLNKWEEFDKTIQLSEQKTVYHLFKAAEIIKKSFTSNSDQSNMDSLIREINLGFESLGIEDGLCFSHGIISSIQSIIDSQCLVELENLQSNNFLLSFAQAEQISTFLHPILLLRIAAKGEKDSLIEKVNLLSLCRKSNKWELMEDYYKHFSDKNSAGYSQFVNSPLVEYEMMYNKLENYVPHKLENQILMKLKKNTIQRLEEETQNESENESEDESENENEFEIHLKKIEILKALKKDQENAVNTLGVEVQKEINKQLELEFEEMFKKLKENIIEMNKDPKYVESFGPDYSDIEKRIKYQQAMFYSHFPSEDKKENFSKAIELSKDFEDSNANNLWSWANLVIFELMNLNDDSDSDYDYDSDAEIFLTNAIIGYIKGTEYKKYRVSNIILIISLLFNNYNKHYQKFDFNQIKDNLNQIPLHYFIESLTVIISFIPNLKSANLDNECKDNSFGQYIKKLLIDLMEKYPHGVIYDYVFSLLSDIYKDKKTKFTPLVHKVEEYFIQNPHILQSKNASNIFMQARELTSILYNISSDIFAITYDFLDLVINFIQEGSSQNHTKVEYDIFINDCLKFFNLRYAFPLKNYFEKKKRNVYIPSKQEKKYLDKIIAKKYESLIYLKDLYTIIENGLILSMTSLMKYMEDYKKITKNCIFDMIEHDQKEYSEVLRQNQNEDLGKVRDNKPISYSHRATFKEESEYDYEDDNKENDNEPISKKVLEYQDYIQNFKESDYHPISGQGPLPARINRRKKSNTPQYSQDNAEKKRVKVRKSEKIRNQILSRINLIYKYLFQSSEFNILKTLRADLKKNIINKMNKTSKLQRNLFSDEPRIEQLKNLCLPVFGTYQHNQEPILIQNFSKECQIMPSKLHPKKFSIIGSDGHKYNFFLKASDDLRTDQRQMIFFRFLNHIFSTKIITYSVTPLTSQFGVIQYVNQSESLNDLIMNYRSAIHNEKFCEFNYMSNQLNGNYSSTFALNSLSHMQRFEIFRKAVKHNKEHENDLKEALWHSAVNSEQ